MERTPDGQFNVTEYGSTKEPAQLAALRVYSPFRSRKMIAHLPHNARGCARAPHALASMRFTW